MEPTWNLGSLLEPQGSNVDDMSLQIMDLGAAKSDFEFLLGTPNRPKSIYKHFLSLAIHSREHFKSWNKQSMGLGAFGSRTFSLCKTGNKQPMSPLKKENLKPPITLAWFYEY